MQSLPVKPVRTLCLPQGADTTAPARRGIALPLVLVLLTLASMLAVVGLERAIVEERITGNQRQMAEALVAAEAGILHVAQWWGQQTSGVRHDQGHFWNDPEGTLSALHALDRVIRPGLAWSMVDLRFQGDEVAMTTAGGLDAGVAMRAVSARYRRPSGAGRSQLPAVTLGGPLAEFSLGEAAVLSVSGGDGAHDRPAIQTATASDAALVLEHLDEQQLARLAGGVSYPGEGEELPPGERIRELLLRLVESDGVESGPVPWDLGTPEAPVVHVVGQVDGSPADLRLDGPVRGAGMLIVTGDLVLEQAPDFVGMILVLGGGIEIRGGTGAVHGTIVVAGPLDSDAGVRVRLAGELHIDPGNAAVEHLWNVLPPEVGELLEALGTMAPRTGAGKLFAWSEHPHL